ncbi:hypothetical protein HBI88_033850 [Parastagonospora nodorum]|nr:hypothetical protein HBH52_221690 [Parastagonospora nodorum]KAH4147315.1 hypothetical protein HBH44_228350 [Parastagonospora nodorum]KAH4708914.1 hypothetical protein HBH67_058380 [Parastagonospora nodorum]KAH4762406.1 hypothetical protein HBH63_200080 [Parastagonospora nodorum]KAH5091660.1 hypothetical protein HBH72_200480 [Parastagonospora nodorum]
MCGHAHVAPPQAFHTCLKRCRLIRSHRRTSFSGANASTGLNLFREKFNMFVLEYWSNPITKAKIEAGLPVLER